MTTIRSKEDRPHELVLDLPAAHSASRMGRQLVRQFALREGVPEREVETLEFVASELLSNAVDHGGGNRAMSEKDLDGDVRMGLVLEVNGMSWSLSVSDQGGGDPEEMRPYLDDSALPDLEDERGRGFFLLTSMVDSLSVDRSTDGAGLQFVARRTFQPLD